MKHATIIYRYFKDKTTRGSSTQWQALEPLDEDIVGHFGTHRIAKVIGDRFYFTLGDTLEGRGCKLNDRFRALIEAEGLHADVRSSSRGKGRPHVVFDLSTASGEAVERIFSGAYEAIHRCMSPSSVQSRHGEAISHGSGLQPGLPGIERSAPDKQEPTEVPSGGPPPATVEEYVAALQHIGETLNDRYRRMLQVQYEAPRRAVDSTELAEAVGYDSHGTANLHHGALAHRIADEIGWSLPPHPYNYWFYVLSYGEGAISDGDFRWVMHDPLARALERLGWIESDAIPAERSSAASTPPLLGSPIPEEVTEDEAGGLPEGAARRVVVNAYERSGKARARCIEHYGTACSACGVDLGDRYGPAAEGYVHVHHLVPIAEVGEQYEVDPVRDLRPVCPNCHAVIHRRTPPFSIDEVRLMLQRSGTIGTS